MPPRSVVLHRQAVFAAGLVARGRDASSASGAFQLAWDGRALRRDVSRAALALCRFPKEG